MKEKEYFDAMAEMLDKLTDWGAVMLSSTSKGWCCHVINDKDGINRHMHDRNAMIAVAAMYVVLLRGDYNDEKPEVNHD